LQENSNRLIFCITESRLKQQDAKNEKEKKNISAIFISDVQKKEFYMKFAAVGTKRKNC